ncbi:MAG: adenosylcobinamide-GDP ribazoletransferase [Pseudomonadota bacterium]|nr:adenosylcobinamide-GDP ribazoletransferase [Pseudomonadota bacterium]
MTVWKEAMGGLATSLAFLTRVPLPSFLFSDGVSTDRAVWAFPVVGALIGAALWALLSLLSGLGFFHPLVVAVAVVAAGLLLTGALHEDGLADVADGLGGGDPARRLEIMKDSRLGAFGVLALVLTVLLKAGVVFALADPLKPGLAFALLVGAAGWSRALMTAIWAALPPANPGGLASVRPDMRQAAIALTLALGLLFILLLLPGTGFLLGAAVLAAVVAGLFALFARWQFGGVTGDVCGAAQVLAELAFFAAALSHIT